jgi:hypothetical protein
MKNKVLKYLLLSSCLVVLFGACRKDSFKGTETGSSGKTYVWITEAPVKSQFFSPFTDVEAVTMFSVRRDAASSGDLNKAVTIVLTDISGTYLDDYNTANGTSYVPFPSDLYTLPTSSDVATGGAYASAKGVTASATGLTLSFAAGDFIKNIIYKIDGTKLDLSQQYAAAYTITSYNGTSKKIGTDTVVSTVAIKNKWDGVYQVTSQTFSDVSPAGAGFSAINPYLAQFGIADGLPSNGPMEYELRTTSATQCVLYDNYFFGGVDTPFATGSADGDYSYYGSFGLLVNFDPATDKVVSVTNYYGQPAGNTRSAQLDPTGVNAYDASSKTIQIKYQMTQPSVITAPGNVRTTWDETWKYIGSR